MWGAKIIVIIINVLVTPSDGHVAINKLVMKIIITAR
jgi:hypothetical protein